MYITFKVIFYIGFEFGSCFLFVVKQYIWGDAVGRCKYLVSPQTVASQCFLLNKEFQDGCWAVWGMSDLLLHAGRFTPPSLHPGRSPTRSFTSQQLSSQWALLTSLTLSEAVAVDSDAQMVSDLPDRNPRSISDLHFLTVFMEKSQHQ